MIKIDMGHCSNCGKEFEERPGELLFYTLLFENRLMRCCNLCIKDPEVCQYWMEAMGGYND